MKKIKILYFGYDFFYKCLDFLLNDDRFEVVKIFTFKTDNFYNFNDYIKKLADKHNIPLSFEKITKNDLLKFDVDLVISAWYPYKIPIIDKIYGINIHPTLLPEWKGPWPLPYIILKWLKESGVTIHKLTNEIDSWDILIQEKFSLMREENLETLSIKSQLLAERLLKKLLSNFEFYKKNATKQWKWSYWPFPEEEKMTLRWDMTASEINKIYRAFGNMDCCAILENKHYLVNNLIAWEEKHLYSLWEIVHKTNKEILIAIKWWFVCLLSYRKDPDYN